MVNPFLPKGFPIDKYNRLALDRVKSIKVPIRQERVKTSSSFIKFVIYIQYYCGFNKDFVLENT